MCATAFVCFCPPVSCRRCSQGEVARLLDVRYSLRNAELRTPACLPVLSLTARGKHLWNPRLSILRCKVECCRAVVTLLSCRGAAGREELYNFLVAVVPQLDAMPFGQPNPRRLFGRIAPRKIDIR